MKTSFSNRDKIKTKQTKTYKREDKSRKRAGTGTSLLLGELIYQNRDSNGMHSLSSDEEVVMVVDDEAKEDQGRHAGNNAEERLHLGRLPFPPWHDRMDRTPRSPHHQRRRAAPIRWRCRIRIPPKNTEGKQRGAFLPHLRNGDTIFIGEEISVSSKVFGSFTLLIMRDEVIVHPDQIWFKNCRGKF